MLIDAPFWLSVMLFEPASTTVPVLTLLYPAPALVLLPPMLNAAAFAPRLIVLPFVEMEALPVAERLEVAGALMLIVALLPLLD
jgi:hypothetical protein